MPIELFVADHHEQRLRSAGVPETRRSTDPRSLFTTIDAAVVVTPAPTHFDMCHELLEMGKDVFVEKPITMVSNDAKKLAELAEKSGLVVQVGHIFRFDPASLWLRDAIAAERFGRLKMLRASFSGFKRPRLRVQRFEFNCGESAASWAGIQAARGRHIATLDADLQNDPKDLPAMLEALKQADCVCGTRAGTRGKGDNWIRIASSHIANSVRNKLSGENISDAGCTYRVFKRECIAHVKFFNGAHRFLPTLIKMEGFCVVEVPVSTNPRYSGTSHYGVWNRLFKSFRDLLGVRWVKSRQLRYQIADQLMLLQEQTLLLAGQ